MQNFLNFQNAKRWSSGSDIPNKAGVYTIFLNSMSNVPEGWQAGLERENAILYIGRSVNLKSCLWGHYSGTSARSTLRRSVGAMLKGQLELGDCQKSGRAKHFHFKNETPLFCWLQENSCYNFFADETANLQEVMYIDALKPPFNRQIERGRLNPDVHPKLKAALDECKFHQKII